MLATALCLSLVGTRIRVLHFDIDRYSLIAVERSSVMGGFKDLCPSEMVLKLSVPINDNMGTTCLKEGGSGLIQEVAADPQL